MAAKLDRASYLTANTGNFPTEIIMDGRKFVKASDLRYGTNPHQSAAFYRPEGQKGAIMDMVTLKTGKNGLSQTNLEDISGALNIVKYFDRCACAVMKHVNPSGAAVATGNDTMCDVYKKARDCDARAAFGSVIAFNKPVDAETAEGIVLVDFWAEWCGPCKMLSPILDQIAEEIDGKAKVVKINAEESMNLAKRFAVRSIPALYVMKDGEIVKNLPGVQDKAALIKALEL
jgi:thioredoxin